MTRLTINRRSFLASSAAAWASLGWLRGAWAAETSQPQPQRDKDGNWYDVRKWGVEGRGWNDTERYFDRFPAKAKGVVRDAVWSLSRNSAGMCVRFTTDSPSISVRYKLSSTKIALPHMPATGVSGMDLYAQDPQGRWRWLGVSKPTDVAVKAKLAEKIDAGSRAYTIYLPLYNGVEEMEIGVEPSAAFQFLPLRSKPMVFYGTSILHGACASRPGMAFPAILGRRLDRPTINLGFSGNGRMEAEVGALLAELDPSVYVIDCLPNMDAATVTQRAEPLVRQLRQARPDTPIVLVEDRSFTNAWLLEDRRKRHEGNHAALRAAYANLVAAGVKGLSYVPGEHLLGDDNEGATDGSHPSDLGMMRQADVLEKVLRPLLAPVTQSPGRGLFRRSQR